MAVTVARDTIVCPGCGARRVVTFRQRRRADTTEGGIPCATCRGLGETRPVREEHLRWWLRRSGVRVPTGTPVRQFIVAGGAPDDLIEMAREFRDNCPR